SWNEKRSADLAESTDSQQLKDAMPVISKCKVILSPPGLILKEGKPQATWVRPSQPRRLLRGLGTHIFVPAPPREGAGRARSR
ncbi:MAG: hypothetical protein ACJ8D8_14330, partial [Microvirga sp.]